MELRYILFCKWILKASGSHVAILSQIVTYYDDLGLSVIHEITQQNPAI